MEALRREAELRLGLRGQRCERSERTPQCVDERVRERRRLEAFARRQQTRLPAREVDAVVDVVSDQDHAGAFGDVRIVGDVDQEPGQRALLDEAVEDREEGVQIDRGGGIRRGEELDGDALRLHGVWIFRQASAGEGGGISTGPGSGARCAAARASHA
jgi:hypothetical protein